LGSCPPVPWATGKYASDIKKLHFMKTKKRYLERLPLRKK